MNLQPVQNFNQKVKSPCIGCRNEYTNKDPVSEKSCIDDCQALENFNVAMGYRAPTPPLPKDLFRIVIYTYDLTSREEFETARQALIEIRRYTKAKTPKLVGRLKASDAVINSIIRNGQRSMARSIYTRIMEWRRELPDELPRIELTKKRYTVPETARMIGCGWDKVYRLVRGNILPHKKEGKSYLILRDGLEKYLKEMGL